MDSNPRDQGNGHLYNADWRFNNQQANFSGYSSSSSSQIFLQNQSQISIDPSFAQWAPRSSTRVLEENLVSSPGKRKRENQDHKSADEGKNSSGDHGKEDYVHIRARRGQATNSHSLAERVRREKIGERMKFLQDLVPGCNKVTGKALMLDEIINYVQSLQRQVEFLSMRLASANPNLDFYMKEINHSQAAPISSFGFKPEIPQLHPLNQGTIGWSEELHDAQSLGHDFYGGHMKARR